MTIKTTVSQEIKELEQLGKGYVSWYKKRAYVINQDLLMSSDDKRKQLRMLFTRTKRKFAKDTGAKATPETRKKRRSKKNIRTTYLTYDSFEDAVRKTLPPLIKQKALLDATFYVFPLKIFYESSILPPEYFIETYISKFGVPPDNAIIYIGQGMPLLALGAVPQTIKE